MSIPGRQDLAPCKGGPQTEFQAQGETWCGRLSTTRLSSCLEMYSMLPPTAFMAAMACGMPSFLLLPSVAAALHSSVQSSFKHLRLEKAGNAYEAVWQALVEKRSSKGAGVLVRRSAFNVG